MPEACRQGNAATCGHTATGQAWIRAGGLGASRTGDDTAGGIIEPLQAYVRLNGNPWAVIGSPVDPHAPCPAVPIHCAATMAEGCGFIRIS
ncbi:MAG: hypothetical protein C4575_09335 [Desulforudis sp.]|nr:MAG: hypothetical protein C4575_09335 [Desulforudis sp.]